MYNVETLVKQKVEQWDALEDYKFLRRAGASGVDGTEFANAVKYVVENNVSTKSPSSELGGWRYWSKDDIVSLA